MMYYNSFYPMNTFGFGGLFMLIFWGLIIYGVVMLFRHNNHSKKDRAIDILKERYAKGEITKDQFESMKKDLQ